MQIEWKIIDDKEVKIINDWLTMQDKYNLCMTKQDWKQTALNIEECLKIMNNAQFKNIIGYVNNNPVLAMMFGVESIEVLNLYNIVVNPDFRNMKVAKTAIMQLLKNDKSLNLIKPYKKVIASVMPENRHALNLFQSLNFVNLGFNEEYNVFEKGIIKTEENIK